MNQIEVELEEALNKVLVPGTMRSLVQLNLVRSSEVKDGKAIIYVTIREIAKWRENYDN